MNCRRALLLILLLAWSGCSEQLESKLLERDAAIVSQTIREVWSTQDLGSVLFVNPQARVAVPPQLANLIISSTTTFDYLYVRSWREGSEGKQVKRYAGYFVIRDLSNGVMLRGSFHDNAPTALELLPQQYWDKVS